MMPKYYSTFDKNYQFITTVVQYLPYILTLQFPEKILVQESLVEKDDVFGSFNITRDKDTDKTSSKIIIYLKSILDRVHKDNVQHQIICTLVHEAYHFNYTKEVDKDEFKSDEHQHLATILLEYQTSVKSLNLILANIDKFSKAPFNFDEEFEHYVRLRRYSTILKYLKFVETHKKFLMLHYDYIGGYKIIQANRILETGVRDIEEVYTVLRFPKVTKKEVK